MALRANVSIALTLLAAACADQSDDNNTGGIYEYDGDMPVWRLPDSAIEVGPDTYWVGVETDDLGREVEAYVFVHRLDDGQGSVRAKPGACYTYLAAGAKWKGAPEAWSTDSTNSPVGDTNALLGADIGKWETASAADVFGDGADNPNYDVVTSATDNQNGSEWGVITDPGVIAVTYTWGIFGGPPQGRQLVEWDQIFDTDWAWALDGLAGAMDYDNIATHEIGHAFGMGHPTNTCTEETMYAYADYGETKKRDLNTGDIAGIAGLY